LSYLQTDKRMNIRDRLRDSAADLIRNRKHEVRWIVYGATAGLVGGAIIGGVGIAALGSAIGLPAAALLAGSGAIVGSRIGVERDRIAARKAKV
jgi:hypothetical protein